MSMVGVNVIIMAQGEGSRWVANPAYGHLPAPVLYKQLLPVGSETIISRSVRMYRERGFDDLLVVGSRELLTLAGLGDSVIGCDLDEDPVLRSARLDQMHLGDRPRDLLRGILATQSSWGPQGTVVALGDALLSRRAMDRMWVQVAAGKPGVLARVKPNPVSGKDADEVFAMWFFPPAYDEVARRLREMVEQRGSLLRPSKPWGMPFAVLPELDAVMAAYDRRGRERLAGIRQFLTLTDDYSDDVDCLTEYRTFWPSLMAAALEDVDHE